MKLSKIGITLSFAMAICMTSQAQFNYPQTQKENITDDYFGTKVQDPYRWLENDTSAQTANWVKTQQHFTKNYLDQIPYRQKLIDRLTHLWNYPKFSVPFVKGKYQFIYRNNGLQNQAVLYIKEGETGNERVLIDPNSFSKDGTVALQNISISKTQKYLAYTISASGSDWQEIYIIDLETRQVLKEKLEYVKFTNIAWLGDEGFYYSGYDKPADESTKYSAKTEYQKVFYHSINSQQVSDKIIYEDRENPLRYVSPQITEDNRFLILNISTGTDGSEIKIQDLRNKSEFITIVKGFDFNAQVIDNLDDNLILLTNEGAPNYKVVLLSTRNRMAPRQLIAESKEPISYITQAGGKLFLHYLKDATSKVVMHNLDGSNPRNIELPGYGTVYGFSGQKNDREVYYSFSSFISPNTVYKFDINSGKSEKYLESEIAIDFSDYETKQVFVTSKDGTKVPMFITHKKGLKLDGTNPTMLYSYGGFNISLTPSFSMANMVFLENGGIYCMANLRGGAEYGEDWHIGGMLDKKQNVFDDFIACAEWLIEKKYTSSKRLAIKGGSNGGLLVGACMTQRPELFAVAIPQVGVLDMLRYHKFTVGWGWVVEYGSSEVKEQFDYLYKYSPLHNVKSGVCYPATMITTADHDDRVVPAHSFKFAAELQNKHGCDDNPIIIRIDSNAGHGAGKPTSKLIEEAIDIISFTFWNMDYNIEK